MIKKLLVIIPLLLVFVSCEKQLILKNKTNHAGYAMGENIGLSFESNLIESPPDSIAVFVLENKSRYEYSLWAKKASCDSVCRYSTFWDGRKPDGSWPLGGVYQVYARLSPRLNIFSDTVQIGLGD
jgi:hypothetical protein